MKEFRDVIKMRNTVELTSSVEVTEYQLEAIKGSNPRAFANLSKKAFLLLKSDQCLSLKIIRQNEQYITHFKINILGRTENCCTSKPMSGNKCNKAFTRLPL
jgi:hypothetical protein